MNRVKQYISFTNQYIRENTLKYCLCVSAVFILSALIMFFCISVAEKQQLTELYNSIGAMLDGKNVVNSDGTLSFFGILFNNIRAGLLISVMGIAPFLFLPVLFVGLNGAVVGMIMAITGVLYNESVIILFVKYILPHGIFEIPALILEGVIGAKICMLICKKISGKARDESFLKHIKGCVGMYVLYVLPMTLIAAFIEAVVLDFLYL